MPRLTTPLMMHGGHLLVRRDRGIELLDSGSPISLDHPEAVTEGVGTKIDGLVGTDELSTGIVILDFAAGLAHFDADAPGDAAWMPAPLVMGVPQISITNPAGHVSAILDTGAPISYGPVAAMADRPVVRTATDFFPMLGEFDTAVRRLPITFAARTVELEVGDLPPTLSILLSLVGVEWIVGPSLWAGRRLVLDLANQRIADLPASQ